VIGVALRASSAAMRSVLTAFAIVLGVAMISGSFVLTDTLGKTIDGVYEESYKEADAVISSKHAIKTEDGDKEKPPFSAGVSASASSSRRWRSVRCPTTGWCSRSPSPLQLRSS
jgi:putative ABC transport system permease protein